MDTINKFLQLELINVGESTIKVYTLVVALLILLATKILLWLIKKSLFRNRRLKQFDPGNSYALFQII